MWFDTSEMSCNQSRAVAKQFSLADLSVVNDNHDSIVANEQVSGLDCIMNGIRCSNTLI